MAWRNTTGVEDLRDRQIRHRITFQKSPDPEVDALYSPSPQGVRLGSPGWLQEYIDSVKTAQATARMLTEQMWATFGNNDQVIQVLDE